MDGVVGRAAAAKWHFGKGAAAAAAADHEGALASFRRAAALGHEGTAIQIEGVEIARRLRSLEEEAEAFRRRAAEAGSDVSHFPSLAGIPFAPSSRDTGDESDESGESGEPNESDNSVELPGRVQVRYFLQEGGTLRRAFRASRSPHESEE